MPALFYLVQPQMLPVTILGGRMISSVVIQQGQLKKRTFAASSGFTMPKKFSGSKVFSRVPGG